MSVTERIRNSLTTFEVSSSDLAELLRLQAFLQQMKDAG